MPIAQALLDFKNSVAQCESLIANAHKVDPAGLLIFPAIDRQQITVAAFLNMFMAWESFIETSLTELMVGIATVGGGAPTRYVVPPTRDAARKLLIGVRKYFDFANHQNLRTTVNMYFQNGYPYEPHLSAVFSDLDDLRTMRNASAHISSTTQTALEALALRTFSGPRVGISLYDFLTAVDPRSPGGDTVFVSYKNKLIVTAELIARG